jgi:hypothetical protein
VALGKGGEGSAGADCTELSVIACNDQLGPDAFDGGEETCVFEAPAERGDRPRVDAGTFGEVLRRLT